MRVYYRECVGLAKELTGACVVHACDHLIREPGRQISGGGTEGRPKMTGDEVGGGYIELSRMDYTENFIWTKYLAVYEEKPPPLPTRTILLNFWCGLSSVADDDPLAVCDARSVTETDLLESVVYGYGASSYREREIGIEMYTVEYSEGRRWFYCPKIKQNLDNQDIAGTSAVISPDHEIEIRQGARG